MRPGVARGLHRARAGAALAHDVCRRFARSSSADSGARLPSGSLASRRGQDCGKQLKSSVLGCYGRGVRRRGFGAPCPGRHRGGRRSWCRGAGRPVSLPRFCLLRCPRSPSVCSGRVALPKGSGAVGAITSRACGAPVALRVSSLELRCARTGRSRAAAYARSERSQTSPPQVRVCVLLRRARVVLTRGCGRRWLTSRGRASGTPSRALRRRT